MKTKTASPSKSIEERLNDYPELKAKIEGLLSVVENAAGELIKADAAEERVIEEIRQLGQTALTSSEALKQLKAQGFAEDNLPAPSTMALVLNRMGYRLRKVLKAKPQKK